MSETRSSNPVVRAAALSLALAFLLPVASAQSNGDDGHARSVVGLEVTYQEWDEDRPWAKQTPRSRDANAVLVSRRHLLTTAQMVDQATFLRLVVFGRTRQVEPRVVQSDPDINLAVLEVDDPSVLADLQPVKLAERTPTSGVLRTVRWKGQQLESSASRVTRFEVERSWGGRTDHAFLQMQTDVSAGGWSEPVFQDGRLVGLTVSQSEQSSRAIPVEILREFLKRALEEDGPYPGFASLGVMWQVNRDESMARFLGQQGEPRGILIRQVPWGTSGCGVLKPRDILLELDGRTLDSEGYYRHPHLGRLRFNHHLVETRRPGDVVRVRVLRDGDEIEMDMKLRPSASALDRIVARRSVPPPFAIVGGLVMRELDVPYLRTWGREWRTRAPVTLTTRYELQQESQAPDRRRVILISSVLPSSYNVGYESVRDEVVERINGVEIDGIPDVLDAIERPLDGFHVIELAADSSRGQIVLDAEAMPAATAEILEAYQVPLAYRLPVEPLPPGGGVCPGDY